MMKRLSKTVLGLSLCVVLIATGCTKPLWQTQYETTMRHAPILCKDKPDPAACIEQIRDTAELNRAVEKERFEQQQTNNLVIAFVSLAVGILLLLWACSGENAEC